MPGGTTNHCPMALTALAAMGASSQRLEEFFIHWQEQYALPAMQEEGEPIVYAEGAYTPGEQGPILPSCKLALPSALQSLEKHRFSVKCWQPCRLHRSSAAFHALIRLAYGLQAEHGAEIARWPGCPGGS